MNEEKLNNLIADFYANKIELDSYKAICERQNKEIKELMSAVDMTDYKYNGLKAEYRESKQIKFDEDALLKVLSKSADEQTRAGLIKIKQYVDMDVLEDYIYNGIIEGELLKQIKKCQIIKIIPKLTIKRVKNKEENNNE